MFLPELSDISQLQAKPKTVTQMLNNEKILRAFNSNHQDTLFKPANKCSKKSLIGRSALAIESELFTSESEQGILTFLILITFKYVLRDQNYIKIVSDISLVSAKTPITAYFNRNNTLNNDSDADDENEAIQQNYQTHAEPG